MEALIADDTAGSPVDENIRWTNRSVPELAEELQDQGFEIGPDALRRILFEELGLSRRQAFKDEAACTFEHRDEQFQYIAELRERYERNDWPVLSIDTKKKEILGDFFHPGRGKRPLNCILWGLVFSVRFRFVSRRARGWSDAEAAAAA